MRKFIAIALVVSSARALSQTPITDFVGTYADGPNHDIEIATDAKGQLVAVIDDATYPLKITGPDEVTNNGGEKIPFARNAEGKVSGYTDDGQFHRKHSPRVSTETIAEITTPARPPGQVYHYKPPVDRHDGIAVGDIAKTPLGVKVHFSRLPRRGKQWRGELGQAWARSRPAPLNIRARRAQCLR